MAAIACTSRKRGTKCCGSVWDRIFEACPVDFQRILGIKLLAEIHSTITTTIVTLTVRVVFAFVCICSVAIGFAFSFAARQCSCMLRCLNFWAARRGGRGGDRTIFGRSRMLSSFQRCPRHATAVQKLGSRLHGGGQNSTPDLCLSFRAKQPRQMYSTLCNSSCALV